MGGKDWERSRSAVLMLGLVCVVAVRASTAVRTRVRAMASRSSWRSHNSKRRIAEEPFHAGQNTSQRVERVRVCDQTALTLLLLLFASQG